VKWIFSDDAWDDYLYWQKNDRKIVERINKLIQEVKREPFFWTRQAGATETCVVWVLVKKDH
jgi:Txe/YoeB family toxin of toxin-antitoxin system